MNKVEQDFLNKENKRMKQALEDIIAECPNPKTGYGTVIVQLAKQGLEEEVKR